MSESTALLDAKQKLSTLSGDDAISFEDLPTDRGDSLWDEIRTDASLTRGEFSALKNAACGGKFPSLHITFLYNLLII